VALADYFRRSAIAASQVVAGFDEEAIRQRLQDVRVGVIVGDAATPEGVALADLTIRLLARLYPTLVLSGDSPGLALLAKEINPNIEISDEGADVAIAIGVDAKATADSTIFAGSDGWIARVSAAGPLATGASANPFGAGAAACLAVANVFRAVFLTDQPDLDENASVSALDFTTSCATTAFEDVDIGEVVLVGAGAIGHGALWALERLSANGRVHVVDPERIELSNLQRYVLAKRDDDGRSKTEIAGQHGGALELVAHETDWQMFCQEDGYAWERVLVGVDSAAARRAVQASLPRWVANAWTQPGDLGVSVHPWTNDGACLSCLYLPHGQSLSDDKIIAETLGLQGMELEVRRLLYTGQHVPAAILATIEHHLELAEGAAVAFAGRSLRELYVEGICGGTLIALDRVGRPRQEVHVPIAHQSALAGVLLAGRLVADALGVGPSDSSITRIDVMHALGQELVQPVRKDPRGICICQDPVYRQAFDAKWR
jgi:molybdopterin/thiamine biosynthesis adenylyltransferase